MTHFDRSGGRLPRLLSRLDRYGITRLADHTGLDEIGLPVWAAIRPAAWSVSQCHGKGLTQDQAQISAIMEAVETALAETAHRQVVVRGTSRDLADKTLATLPFTSLLKCRNPAEAGARVFDWLPAQCLASGKTVFVPLPLVSLDYRINGPGNDPDFHADSVGLAAHWTRDAAILHGLLEVIEYDAVAQMQAWPGILSAAPAADLPPGMSDDLDGAIAMLHAAGQRPVFLDVTSDLALPTVFCWLDDQSGGPAGAWSRARPFAGHACRFTLADAALAALLEAAQSRLTDIAGAREDIAAQSYDLVAGGAGLSRPRHIRPAANQKQPLTATLGLKDILARFAALGLKAPVVADLTEPDAGLACVAVICPGLEAGPALEIYRIGVRARQRIVSHGLGLRCR